MGTLVRIVLYAASPQAGDAAAQAAFARIAAIEARLSDYRDDSEVAALSRAAAGVPVPVSEDLFAVLAASDALARRTGGAFDVTAGRLTHLWRRARRLNAWPEPDRVAAARAAGGFAKVRLDPRRRTVTLAEAGHRDRRRRHRQGLRRRGGAARPARARRRRGAGGDRRRHRRRGSAARAAGLDGGDPRARGAGAPRALPDRARPRRRLHVRRRRAVDDRRRRPPLARHRSAHRLAGHRPQRDQRRRRARHRRRRAQHGARRPRRRRGRPAAAGRPRSARHAPRGIGAQALWQRIDGTGAAISHHSLHWPAMARPISAITLRGTP